jgi:DNA polymerase-1
MYKATTSIGEIRKYLATAKAVSFDIETAPDEEYRDVPKAALDPHKSHIVGISFSVAESSAIYVPVAHKQGENVNRAQLWELLGEFAADRNVVKICHNTAFEATYFYKSGLVLQQPIYDTILAAQMSLKTNTDFRKLKGSGLKELAQQLLGIALPTFAEVTGGRHFDELDPRDCETVRYACADSDYALRLYHKFNNWFDRWLPRHRAIVEAIESPTAVYVGCMRYNGILVDAELMRRKSAETEAQLAELRKSITLFVGNVNIGASASTSAFKQYLYSDLKLPVLKTTEKYQEAADEETFILLKDWCAENNPNIVELLDLVLEYRRIGKLKSTYIDGYLKHVDAHRAYLPAIFPTWCRERAFQLQSSERPESKQR